jgi:hypothetical protein
MKSTKLNRSHATGYDHQIIVWDVNVKQQEEAENVPIVGCNLSAMSKMNEEVAEKLWKELDTGRAQQAEE